jgi:hypothetical protein
LPTWQGRRAHGSEGGGDQKWRVVEFLERRFRHDPKQQRGQRNIEQKKFIHAKPASGRPSDLPQAKPMTIRPKYGNARLSMSIMGMRLFHRYWPRIGSAADRQ